MNRSEIIQGLTRRLKSKGLKTNQAEIEVIVEDLFDLMGMSLSCGEPVTIRGFGRFETRKLNGGLRKFPKYEEMQEVPDRLGLRFIPSRLLKSRVNGKT